MCVVIDLDVVCLVCLQPNKELYSVFATDVDSSELQIAQKISILSELKPDKNNHTLPSKICVKCLQDLKAAWRFRKNCQAAVTIFQTIVNLDIQQPEEESNEASKDLEEKNVKVPVCLQIKRVEQVTEWKPDNSCDDIQTSEKAPLEEYVIVNDKDNSIVCDELNTHEYECRQKEREEEFQSLDDVGEANENVEVNEDEDDEDDNPLVEYYITEDGVADQLTVNVETQSSASNSATSLDSKQIKTKKLHEDKEAKHAKLTALLAKMNKPVQRGRPRNSSKQQTEEPEAEEPLQNSKKVLCKIKKDKDIKSSENGKTLEISEVRQVKARRKRKSLSPETKPPKICEICGNSYRYQHALNAHMRRHFNEKPFPCEFCDKAFVSNVELRRHIRVHTGQKPYACQYCERRFSDFGSRIKHERTHTGERPYVCDTCGKSFAYPHVLSVHVRIHTGEKRFCCDYCNKGFTKKVYLRSHIEQHHSGANDYDEATNSSQEKCNSNTEYVNEEAIEDNAEYEEEESQETGKMVITSSRLQYELEVSNDGEHDNENDDNEESIHEIVEVIPDEYTIQVR